MAYGTKYYFEAPGLRERIYRCDLELNGYTSSASEITRDMGSLTFVAGKGNLAFDAPLMPSRAEITVRDQSVVQEIYGSADREWRATISTKPKGGSYEEYFRGWILGDMGRYDPSQIKGPVTFEAVDGLEFAKNVDHTRGGVDKRSAQQLIQDLLAETQSQFQWWLQFPWFYRLDETADSELTSSDEKLTKLFTFWDAHQKDREQPSGEGELRTLYDAARFLLRALNLRLVQSQGEWWVRQRHVGRYGSTDAHRYNANGTLDTTTAKDLVFDLSATSAVVEERPSRFQRNVGTYRAIHDFGPYTGRGLPEPGFETVDNWTLVQDTTSNDDWTTDHDEHNNFDPSPDNTAQNKWLVVWRPNFSSYGELRWLYSDPFSFPSSSRSDEVLTLSFRHAVYDRSNSTNQKIKLEHGGAWLDSEEAEISQDVTRGENVIVPLAGSLDAPIPKGTNLIVYPQGHVIGEIDPRVVIQVKEVAEAGSNEVIADVNSTITVSDFTDSVGPPVFRYYTWSSTETWAKYNQKYGVDQSWEERTFRAFMRLKDSDGGGVVEGTQMQLSFATHDRTGTADDIFSSFGAAVDDVRIRLTIGDEIVSQEEFTTTTGESQSTTEEQGTYLGDGPSADSRARFFYDNSATGGRQNRVDEWGLDSWASNTYSGLRLGHLRGREYVRELRVKHRRMTLRVHLNDYADVFGPHHILKWDGQLWSIEQYSHTPDAGFIQVDLLPVLDEGTSGLTYTQILTPGEDAPSTAADTVSSGGVAVSGGAGREEISSFRPGPLSQGQEVFSRLFISAFDLDRISIYAETAPTSTDGYVFSIDKNGTQQTTVTLDENFNLTTTDLSISLADGDRLEVVGDDPQDPAMSDINVTFDVAST